ncbi:MAG TPA: hypothetical protein VHU14_00185 [Solirubrobacterales bacterium]|nr:hypothetical protein [Solirubrobacterales bacterium]
MAAVDPLLELRVDVHRHLRVGVADLPHHPLDVEVVGEQRDRNVGAAQAVRRGVRQGRQAALAQPFARQLGGRRDDLPDTLAVEAAAVQVGDEIVVGAGRSAHAAQPLEVLDHRLDQVGAHLHLADAALGLRVGDAEARSLGVVEAEVADLQVAQLAGADAAAAEYLADDAAADVAAADLGAEATQVEADRRLGDAEALGDLVRPQPLGDQVGDQRRGRPEVDRGAAGR